MRLNGSTVLVVEDDLDNLELLVAHFEREGAIVLGANSLGAAINATQSVDIDAMVCDLELPDGDGCALLKQLHNLGWRDLPAIAISGYSDRHWQHMADECGFDRFVTKPFRLNDVTDWLAELIGRETGRVGLSCHAVAERAARVPRGR
ncbi:MAG TPA: response regulator [Polyangiaceae bacterium]|nr:response regulator [Polyangiaceae bacterium]